MMQLTKYAFAASCMFLLIPAGFSQEAVAEEPAAAVPETPKATPVRTPPVAAAQPAAAAAQPAAAAAGRPAAAAAAAPVRPAPVAAAAATPEKPKVETYADVQARKVKEEQSRFEAKYAYDKTVHEAKAGVIGKTFAQHRSRLAAGLSANKNNTAQAAIWQKKIDEAAEAVDKANDMYAADDHDGFMALLFKVMQSHGEPDCTKGYYHKHFDATTHRRLTKYGDPDKPAPTQPSYGRPAAGAAKSKIGEL